jgi:hypothetical protein
MDATPTLIKVKVGTNTERKEVTVESSKTPKDIFSQENIDYSRARVYLDGSIISPADMNKSLDELGIRSKCMLVAVIKSDNAA